MRTNWPRNRVGTHRKVSGRVGICIGICRGNGRFRRRCERCCNVDIGSAPSYLSFVFASRTDFWRLWLLCLPSRNSTAGSSGAPSPAHFELKGPVDGQSRRHGPQNLRLFQRPPHQVAAAARRRNHRARARDQQALRRRAARQDRRVQAAAGRRRDARQPAGAGLRGGARGRQARARPAAFRRAADRRHGAALRRHRRDAHRRRQDAGRDAAGLPQRARRQGRACRHRQRLPRQARLRMDGPRLFLPRADHRRHRPRHLRRRAPRGLCLRRHLRHQQRARLRLSARQHEIRARPDGAARPQLRDRRRGQFDPDRRGAHAADHFRSARGPFGNVQHGRRADRAAAARGLRGRREAAHRDLHRERHREDREHADARPAI